MFFAALLLVASSSSALAAAHTERLREHILYNHANPYDKLTPPAGGTSVAMNLRVLKVESVRSARWNACPHDWIPCWIR